MAVRVPLYTDIQLDLLYHPSDTETSTHIFIGASSSGKTTIMMRLWQKLFRNHITVAFLGNPGALSSIQLRKAEFEGRSVTVVEGFSTQVLNIVRYIAEKTYPRYKWCIIFDDILTTHESKAVNELVMSLRNVGVSTLISIQHATILSPAQRSNANNIWLGGFRLPEQERTTYRNFLGKTYTQEMFHTMTQDHGFLVRNTVNDTPWHWIRLDKSVLQAVYGTEDYPQTVTYEDSEDG